MIMKTMMNKVMVLTRIKRQVERNRERKKLRGGIKRRWSQVMMMWLF